MYRLVGVPAAFVGSISVGRVEFEIGLPDDVLRILDNVAKTGFAGFELATLSQSTKRAADHVAEELDFGPGLRPPAVRRLTPDDQCAVSRVIVLEVRPHLDQIVVLLLQVAAPGAGELGLGGLVIRPVEGHPMGTVMFANEPQDVFEGAGIGASTVAEQDDRNVAGDLQECVPVNHIVAGGCHTITPYFSMPCNTSSGRLPRIVAGFRDHPRNLVA